MLPDGIACQFQQTDLFFFPTGQIYSLELDKGLFESNYDITTWSYININKTKKITR